VTKGDDVLAVHLEAMLSLEDSRKLVLCPFIRSHRIPDWTFQYGDGWAKTIV
jgi:hypothetical protein